MNNAVYAVDCNSYGDSDITKSFDSLFGYGLFDFIKPGMSVGIKLNLVSAKSPDTAVTTNPRLIYELCKRITNLGASVVLGDSPGGPFTSVYLSHVYTVTGLSEIENKLGEVKLNRDFSCSHEENYSSAFIMHSFDYTSWLKKVDCIINFAKLKTHGMMGMSCSVKNMFGAIPGTVKPEYHYRFPNAKDFADMLLDLNRYFKPVLNIVDGVVAMEGNGPTMGTPRFAGKILASSNPYNLDMVCAKLISLDESKVPTLETAVTHNLGEKIENIKLVGNILPIKDFKNIEKVNSIEFLNELVGFKGRFFGKIIKSAMCSRPSLNSSKCIGCRKCNDICPAKAITMKSSKPRIDRSKCIRCFCCQEFCPKGALKVHRPVIARLLTKI